MAERWAEAVKAQSIYPQGHHRVRAGLDLLLEALAEARRAGPAEAPLRIVFADGGLLASGTRSEVDPDGPLAWLRERLDHGALAGIEVLPDAASEGFEAFGGRLLEVFATKDAGRDPQTRFAGRWPGLRLLDRRFEGVFDGLDGEGDRPQRTWGGLGPPLQGAERARLVARLHADPAIRQRLTEIRRRIGAVLPPPGEDGSDELLHRVAGLLPSGMAEDIQRVRTVAGGLLDALEQSFEGSEPGTALVTFFEDPALFRRVAFLYSSIFRAQEPAKRTPDAEAEAPRAQGHQGDDRVDDDLTAFLFEFRRLPAADSVTPPTAALESPSEQLGVLLHMLVHQGAAPLAGLEPALRAALAQPGEAEARVVGRVLASLTQRADADGTEAAAARVIGTLVRTGQLGLLRRCGYLSAERAVEAFPRDFVLYLDALDLSGSADRSELLGVLGALGADRLAAQAATLVHPDALLAPERLSRLLAAADPRLAPLADLLFRFGGAPARTAVVAWLRQLPDPVGDAGLLALVDDARDLPDEYLRHVLGRLLGRSGSAGAEALVTELLVRFVHANARRADRRARRIKALRLLAASSRPEAEALLRHVAFARRWLVIPVEEKPVRDAAREALAMRRGAA